MPSIPLPFLILLGLALAIVFSIAAKVIQLVYRLMVLRGALKTAFREVGANALAKVPERIKLERLAGEPPWRDAARMNELADPLLALGFEDCGVYAVDKMPGVLVRFLMDEATSTAAFLYDHPKTRPWVEFSVRYEDGTTTALSTLPPTGIQPAPFYRRIEADGIVPVDLLYKRLLKERPETGVKRVTKETVVDEYEKAYAAMMAWKNSQGISAQEVAAVAKKRLKG